MSGADEARGRFRALRVPAGGVATAAALVALTVVSAVGKIVNQFGFFVYPDSYYYLLVAENLRHHLHPAGTLGSGGMPFPPLGYAAMKTSYPLAVGLFMALGLTPTASGHLVAGAAAVASVPVAFWATRRLLGSVPAGFMAAAVVATSYGLTYWAGFVLSDSLSVLLALWVLGMCARQRPDEPAEPGDLLTGAAWVLLLLSRPTYVAAIPVVLWLCVRRFGWTRRRILTTIATASVLLSAAVMLWFPPFSFGRRLLMNVAPVLLAAFAVAAVAMLAMWKYRQRIALARRSPERVVTVALVVGFLMVIAYAESHLLLGGGSPYPGFARFAARDPALLVCALPGAVLLTRRGLGDIAAALMLCAAVLVGVYYWAEPRESRYLIQLLPFLAPLAAAPVLALEPVVCRWRGKEARPPTMSPRTLAVLAFTLVGVAAFTYQGYRSVTRASASFLGTSYPREVARRLEGTVPEGGTIVTALPWPYYFHLRQPTWGAGVVYAKPGEPLEENALLYVVCDASMRFHYPGLTRTLERSSEVSMVAEFDLPMSYQYGYSAFADPAPVRAYEIRWSALADKLDREGGSKLGPPARRYDVVSPPPLVLTPAP